PVAAARHTDAIVNAHERREVAYDEDHFAAALSQECDDARLVVVAVDPLEALPAEVERVQRCRCHVEAIELAHPALHSGVQRVLQHMPVETCIMVPLAALAELASHEEQLLA